jgi:hypothetical protein
MENNILIINSIKITKSDMFVLFFRSKENIFLFSKVVLKKKFLTV